ncbi:MAG: M20 family metallopeptidase [Clostridiaceae bacterium]
MDLQEVVKIKSERIKAIREELGRNAELSFNEFNTSKIIKEFLDSVGIKHKSMFKTGVVGVLNEDDACIAVRADMDALPVNGVSHACGHDYHMAVVLGTALILREIGYDKNVKFIFQPAEEASGGALPMICEGVLSDPEVKCVLGLHVWPGLDVGKIQISAGPAMASVDDFDIRFVGKGGHAAMPYLCKNPIYPAIDLVQSMNNKLHNENDPLDPFVVTFASLNSGNAFNVIPDEARIMGTARTFRNDLRKVIKEDIIKGAGLSAQKFGCEAIIDYKDGYPPLVNDAGLAESFIKASKDLLGSENVLPIEKSFSSEDFAYFAEKVPSVHFRLGIREGNKGNEILHSTKFNASDDALIYGVLVLVNFIISLKDVTIV